MYTIQLLHHTRMPRGSGHHVGRVRGRQRGAAIAYTADGVPGFAGHPGMLPDVDQLEAESLVVRCAHQPVRQALGKGEGVRG